MIWPSIGGVERASGVHAIFAGIVLVLSAALMMSTCCSLYRTWSYGYWISEVLLYLSAICVVSDIDSCKD